MNISLHQALWAHERECLELGRTDLHGQPILCSPLEIFNRFTCRFKEGVTDSLAHSELDASDLNSDLIRAFFKDLYETPNFQTRDLSSAIDLLHHFIQGTWAKLTKASPVLIQQNLESVDLSFREFKRLRSLHRHLLEQWRSQIPITPPTEAFSEDPNQLRLFSPETPLAEESVYDLWVVLGKVRGKQSLSLQGQMNDKLQILPVSRGVYQKAQAQDRLPLSIAFAWDEQPFIEEVEAPIFGDEKKADARRATLAY